MDEIANELEKDPRIAAAYDLWYREREEVLHTYKAKTPPPGFVVNSAASLLYHMSRIFQEQRTQPVGGVRVAVDSKLRRKIREKKIAMGHKPDDREEEQRMQ